MADATPLILGLAPVVGSVFVASLGYFFRTASERAKAKDADTPAPVVEVGDEAGPTDTERLIAALERAAAAERRAAILEERNRWLNRAAERHGTMDDGPAERPPGQER